jgi:hypothetical protein
LDSEERKRNASGFLPYGRGREEALVALHFVTHGGLCVLLRLYTHPHHTAFFFENLCWNINHRCPPESINFELSRSFWRWFTGANLYGDAYVHPTGTCRLAMHDSPHGWFHQTWHAFVLGGQLLCTVGFLNVCGLWFTRDGHGGWDFFFFCL